MLWFCVAARMRIAASSSVQKLRGQAIKRTYPHPEGFLGEVMLKGSGELGDDSYFGENILSPIENGYCVFVL